MPTQSTAETPLNETTINSHVELSDAELARVSGGSFQIHAGPSAIFGSVVFLNPQPLPP